MVDALIFIDALSLAVFALFAFAFVISSIWEKEKRAAIIGSVTFCILLGGEICLFALKAVGFFQSTLGFLILLVGLVIPVVALLLLIRMGRNPRALQGTKGYIVGKVRRFDEREQVFARNRSLPPGSEQYRMFYSQHPQWEEHDAKRREKRGGPLGAPGKIDKPHERPNVAALFASFSIPSHLGSPHIVQPQAHPHFHHEESISLSPEEATSRVKGFALHLGADLAGVTEVNPLWVYSKRGEIFWDNWEEWGTEIEVPHYAIVFAMEMSRDMVWTAPHTASVVESGLVYAKGAFIATELASFIANLGYSATANHLRHYDVLLVPMAVDAGLGEVGRFGFLMTKEFGPRVRLGCVTTDLPLMPDRPVDIGVEDFCRICKKCAHCCPSRSIPFDAPQEVNGTLRWKLNAETCFDYWGRIGTDCCLCMRVCPWSHPRTLPHRWITGLVVRNRIARRIFSPVDDLFYGKRPKPASPPKWATYC